MKWTPIDTNNLPDKEILAANFKQGSYGYKEKLLGYIGVGDDGVICCENDNEVLENCTHYIDLSKFDL